MKRVKYLSQRLKTKSLLFYLITRLNKYYDLSIAESELLSWEIIEHLYKSNKEYLSDGQIWYTAVHKDEPAGKALAQCEKVRIKLTLHHPDDLTAADTRSLKKILVHRLPYEALKQDGVLTVEDLSRILFTSEKTIRRLIAEYRQDEIFIPLRGYYKDIGPGSSHKSQTIRLYLKGFQPSKIATLLSHHLHSIERYIDDFCVVMMAIEEGYSVPRIARNTKLSERIAREYKAIYDEYKNNTDYKVTFDRLRERLAYLLKKKGLSINRGKEL